LDAGLVPHALQLLDHEQAAEELETGLLKGGGMHAGGMEQELRFDAVDLGRVEQRLKEVLEQGLLDLVGGERDGLTGEAFAWLGIGAGPLAAESKYIADHGLGLLVDAEGIAGDLSCFN